MMFNKRQKLRWIGLSGLLITATILNACTLGRPRDSGPRTEIDVSRIPDAKPRVEPRSSGGNKPAYTVHGRTYYVRKHSKDYKERGIASWYGTAFHGNPTANGETYSMYKMTAAHKTLPIPTYVMVTNLKNGRQVIVRINDRGPFHDNRLIDLSYVAAKKLGITDTGTGLVEVQSIDPRTWGKQKMSIQRVSHHPGKQKLYIQAGAFSSRHNAERLANRLTSIFPNVPVRTSFVAEKNLYRVRIGPVSSIDEADRVARTMSDNGYTTPQVVIE
jgi:rare lipoprotein A